MKHKHILVSFLVADYVNKIVVKSATTEDIQQNMLGNLHRQLTPTCLSVPELSAKTTVTHINFKHDQMSHLNFSCA